MDKRQFLAAGAAAGVLGGRPAAAAGRSQPGPALLTVVGAGGGGNRGAVDRWRDQLMAKHGIRFASALALDASALRRLPAVEIEPVLEYDARPHKLRGPLLTTVLAAAGVGAQPEWRIALRAIDGYAAQITLGQARAWGMIVATQLDGAPLALGGLGPQWAVHDPAAIPQLKDKPLNERFASCPWGLYCIEVAAA